MSGRRPHYGRTVLPRCWPRSKGWRSSHAGVEQLERIVATYEILKPKEAELAYNATKGRILKKLAGIKSVVPTLRATSQQ
jgi:hypothetical protein